MCSKFINGDVFVDQSLAVPTIQHTHNLIPQTPVTIEIIIETYFIQGYSYKEIHEILNNHGFKISFLHL